MLNDVNLPRILECRQFVLDEETHEKTSHNRHRHVKYYELDYNLEGGRRITIDGREYLVEAGSVIFRHPGQICDSVGGYNMIMLTFDWGENDKIPSEHIRNHSFMYDIDYGTEDKLQLPDIFIPEHGREILAIYRRLTVLWQQPSRKKLTDLQLSRLLHLILADAASYRLRQIEEDTPIDKVLNYIQVHYMDDLNLDELARQVHLSKHYLIRRFRSETGRTPMDFIIFTRLEQAKRLLVCSEMSVGEIAAQCGFESSSYLCRRFRTEFGMTPKQYRDAKLQGGKLY